MIIEINCLNPDRCKLIWEKLSEMLKEDQHMQHCEMVDIIEEVTKLRRVVAALFDESDTRIPKGFDQKSEDYAMRVSAHNNALSELTRALVEVGYRE